MVVSIREVVNKHISYTLASTPNSTMTGILPNVDMDDIRGCLALSSIASLRSSSVFSKVLSIAYY